ELRAQLLRLGERRFLSPETVQGLLEWFDVDRNREPRVVIQAIREDAIAGLIDFIRKGTHSEEIRRSVADFIGEVVRRRDERMMEVLAIHFQNYQLGMMRDRLQIKEQPSSDVLKDQMAVEAYDRFLEAILATGRFYVRHRRVRGPYFEMFEKLEGGKTDS